MAVSQNGWPANQPALVSRRLVPGTQVGLTVRTGPPGDLLLEVASIFDELVQDIDNARGALDDWGYAERPIRGGVELSNHSSGTAVDLNAVLWPLGSSASVNLDPDQIALVREIVDATAKVVRWGGDYANPARGGRAGARTDPMHFELADGTTETDCARALARLRDWRHTRQEDDVSAAADVWNTPVKNLFDSTQPDLPAHAALEWAMARASQAQIASEAALAELRALRADLAAKGVI